MGDRQRLCLEKSMLQVGEFNVVCGTQNYDVHSAMIESVQQRCVE